jgi:hypothetical protein
MKKQTKINDGVGKCFRNDPHKTRQDDPYADILNGPIDAG